MRRSAQRSGRLLGFEMRRFSGSTLLFASHNLGKTEEMRDLLAPHGVAVVSAADMGLPEPEETETTFLGNARIKAHAAAAATRLPALADDSGICVDALNGAPGVYTADWAETERGRDFDVAMERTWAAVQATGLPGPFAAQFCCTLVLAWPDGVEAHFEGRVAGHLVWPKKGRSGHGYDPMFQPEGFQQTFAEMDPAQKNRISHRSLALRALLSSCFT